MTLGYITFMRVDLIVGFIWELLRTIVTETGNHVPITQESRENALVDLAKCNQKCSPTQY